MTKLAVTDPGAVALVTEMLLAGVSNRDIRDCFVTCHNPESAGFANNIDPVIKAAKAEIQRRLKERREELQVDCFVWSLAKANDPKIYPHDQIAAMRLAVEVGGLAAPTRIAPTTPNGDESWVPTDPGKLAQSLVERIANLAEQHKQQLAGPAALPAPEPVGKPEPDGLNELLDDLNARAD